jgi:mono/diheme cytochrome c family protein
MKHNIWFVLPVALFATYASADESYVRLKEGPGKDKVLANCVVCHSADYVQMNSPFLDRKGWEGEVTKMVKVFGASIREEDVPQIVEYLTKYYAN